jgi:endo-1,4-beta-xylanase
LNALERLQMRHNFLKNKGRNMTWNRALLAVLIATTVTYGALAQNAATSDQSRPAADSQASRTNLKTAFKDHFLIGVAINRSIATGAAGRRGKELVEKDIALVKEQFNQIAPENDLKWQLIHPREGADGYNFEPSDAFVEFGQKNNMYMIGHTLVWHSQTPNWVFAGTNPAPGAAEAGKAAQGKAPAADYQPAARRGGRGFGGGFGRGYTGPRASRDELLQRMREHIHTVVGRYKGKIKAWDVVNEAIADGGEEVLRNSLWLQIIGPDYIAKAFEFAHEADPAAILRYNDYGLENPAKRQKLIKLIKSLQEQKAPVHAIGSQAHLNVSTTFETMDQALTEIAALGLPIHITELDVNSAARGQRGTGADIAANSDATKGGLVSDAQTRLADAYAGIFRAFLKHRDSVKMVTFWGANDAVSWRRFGTPLLFDGDNKPKPAFDGVIRAAAEWRPIVQQSSQ